MAEMTREEAISIVKHYRDLPIMKDDKKALDMAIKALEQEPCEDAISRQAVEQMIKRTFADYEWQYDSLLRKLESLPPANPQEPKTIQEKQAESEKYEKAYDDGYKTGYAQARFDYEPQESEEV